MTEIKKTLSILKARWPEVILIIGLTVLLPFLSKLLTKLKHDSALNLTVLATCFSLALMVIRTTLRFGFLRTVYLQGNQRSSPLTLLRTGIYFLWRMVVLWALYSLPFLLSGLLGPIIISRLVSPESFAQIGFWINQLFFLAFSVILVKLILLLPALVIVLDCRAFESFKFLKKCRLRDARELIVLFCFKMAFPYLWMFLRRLYGATTTPQPIFRIVTSVTTCFIGLIIAVMAVRFVASLQLVYDNPPSSLDFGDLRK